MSGASPARIMRAAKQLFDWRALGRSGKSENRTRSCLLRIGKKGVAEVASACYGQFLPMARHRWRGARSECRRRDAARVGIVRYSPANRLRVYE